MAEDRNANDEHMLNAVVHVPEHVVQRSFEAETLLLNLQTGQYHGLNETGARMLELLGGAGGSVREAVEKLAEEYNAEFDDIAGELATFCSELEARGLIVIDEAA